MDPATVTRRQLRLVLVSTRSGTLDVKGRSKGSRGGSSRFEKLTIKMEDVESIRIVEREINAVQIPKPIQAKKTPVYPAASF